MEIWANTSDNVQRSSTHVSYFSVNGSLNYCLFLLEQKHSLVERVAHQTIIMQYILELAKSLDARSQATIHSFFTK